MRCAAGGLALVLLGACAPTSLAPSIIRYEPLDADEPEHRLSMRSGPRLASALTSLSAGSVDTEVGTPVPPELGVALEYQRTQPLGLGFALHAGVQAELFYFLPAPGIGLMGGVSWRKQFGTVSIAPALAVRGATDFGIATATPSGSFVSGDFGLSISAAEGDTARLGITPFLSVVQSFRATMDTVFFTGALLFARFRSIELLVGVGRVYAGGVAWNVPLLGVRAGGN